MSIIDLQESLKDVSDDGLMEAFRSGSAPQFLVLGELQRRKRMRDDFKRREAADMPTVAEEMITGAGVPQEGLMAMAGAMAPNTNVAQDTGLTQAMPMQATRAAQPMADGGIVRMANGGMTEYPSINPLIGNVDLSQIAAMLQSGADKEALIANYGADAVREAESMLLPFMKESIGQIPLGRNKSTLSRRELREMERQGIFGNKSYRDVSGEGSALGPTVMDEGPSLQEIDPDSTTFIAPETVSDPRLNMDTAGGLGSMSLDSSIPEMALDSPLLLRQIIDSGVGTRGADTDPAQQLAEFLASRRSDLPGVNLPGESYPYEIDPDAAEKQGQAILDSLTPPPPPPSLEEQLADSLDFAVDADKLARLSEIDTPPPSVLAAQAGTDSTQVASDAPDRSIDRQINPEKYMDLDDFLAQDSIRDRSSDRGSSLQYPTFLPYPTASGAFPNDAELAGQYPQRGGSETVTERQLRKGQEFADSYRLPPPLREFIDSFKSESIAPKADEDRRNDPTTTIAGDAESAAEALQNQEDKIAPKADEYRGDDPLTLIDSITDGGEGGAGFGSPESEIAKLLSDRRKRADQNKWLALAEAGFAMMGPAATFGEGIGKGGKAGLAALRESQKGLDAFETDMLKLQASMDIADARNQTTIQAAQIRGDNALAAAMLRKKDPAITASALSAAQARVNEARDVLANATTQADKVAADAALKEAIAIRDEFTRIYSGQIGANIASNTAGSTGGLKDVDLTT